MPPSSQYQTSVRSTPCADAVATTRPKLRAAPKSTPQTSRQSFRFMLLLLNLTLHFLWEQILGLATGLQRAGCGAIKTAVGNECGSGRTKRRTADSRLLARAT